MISDLAEKESADARIRETAKTLSVTLMTEEEVANFSAEVRAKKKST